VSSNELASLDASIRKFYGEVDEYRRKISQSTEDANKLLLSAETSLTKLTEEVTSKTNEAILSVQSHSRSLNDELVGKLDTKISDDKRQLSAQISEAHSTIGALQDSTEGKVSTFIAEAKEALARASRDAGLRSEELETKLQEPADETIGVNQEKTNKLIDELAALKEQIREQIQQANAFRLFGAFQSRQNDISKSKLFWVWAIAGLVLISAGVTVWIAHEAQSYSVHSFAFWVKLSLTIPLGFAITFCTVQYSRERRLEEEYAFKSTISVSLNPYRDLVHSILEKDGQVDQSKYTEFVINSVNNVFTSPTERVFESDKKGNLTKKTFKEVAEIIGTGVKAAK
jgi:hypothetical protein